LLLAACFVATLSLVGCAGGGPPAPPDYYDRVDYTWVPPAGNFVDARELAVYRLRIPPLLQQACNGRAGDFGEGYFWPLVAKAELLRMLEDPVGYQAVTDALGGRGAGGMWDPQADSFTVDPVTNELAWSGYAYCLNALVPGWRTAMPTHDVLRNAWQSVINALDPVPTLWGVPGTGCPLPPPYSDAPPREGSQQKEWDFSMAVMFRLFGLMVGDDQMNLPVPKSAIPDLFAQRVWLQGAPSEHERVVCTVSSIESPATPPGSSVKVSFPETENHAFMMRTTRFLHNEWLPVVPTQQLPQRSGEVDRFDVNENLDNNTNGLEAPLRESISEHIHSDWLEYNARPYSEYQMLGLLNLYDFAKDQRMRRLAGVLLDIMAAKETAEAMQQIRSVPFRRRAENLAHGKTYGNELRELFGGDEVAPMYQTWVGDAFAPLLPASYDVGSVMTLAASTTYRPPDVLVDRMVNRGHRDFFERFNGQGQEERGYSGPDFVIAGGGKKTDCPYREGEVPVFGCLGDANDPGTVMSILLIPHRARTPGDDRVKAPPFNDLIRIVRFDGDENDAIKREGLANPENEEDEDVESMFCIYRNFACGPYLLAGRKISSSTNCTRYFDDGRGDPSVAYRFDESCAGLSYVGDCFFVDTVRVKFHPEDEDDTTPALAYFVTHSCSPSHPPEKLAQEFDSFIKYMTHPGSPRTQLCSSGDDCDTKVNIYLPSTVGGFEAGENITVVVRNDGSSYSVSSPRNEHGTEMMSGDLISKRPVTGVLASLYPHASIITISDPAADESLSEIDNGEMPARNENADNPYGFAWRATVSTGGLVRGTITNATHPETLRSVTVDIDDATAYGQACLVGQEGLPGCHIGPCYNPPCPTRGAQVHQWQTVSRNTYGYAATPLAHGKPLPVSGYTLAAWQAHGFISTHDYWIRACATWHRFYTPEEYRNGWPPDAHGGDCQIETVHPSSAASWDRYILHPPYVHP
jgi:hypothetical protein